MTDNNLETKYRNPKRRMMSIYFISLLPLGFAFALMNKVWYHFSFTTPKLILPNTLVQVKNVSADYDFKPADLLVNGIVNSIKGPTAALATGPFKLPMILVYLVIATAIGFAAVKIESSLIALVAIYVANMSRIGLNQMTALAEAPSYGGQYMTQTAAVQNFNNCIWFLMAIFAVLALQIRAVKKQNKTSNRISIFDTVSSLQNVNIAQIIKNNQKEKVNS